MKIGLTSYSLNADIMSGRKTILDAMRFAAENGAEHMEIVPFGFTLYDDGRDEFNQPLIDSIRQTAETLSLPLSDYAVLANLLAPEEEARRAEILRLKRHIDVAHRLGVPMMRHDISSFRRPLEQNTPLALEECLGSAGGAGTGGLRRRVRHYDPAGKPRLFRQRLRPGHPTHP